MPFNMLQQKYQIFDDFVALLELKNLDRTNSTYNYKYQRQQ